MTKNTIKFISDTEAQVSQAFAKRAVIFGTEEYKLWREYKKDFPEAQMITKTIKRNPNKKTNLNMTYKNIIRFIKTQDNKDELLDEMAKVREIASISASPYRSVIAWFEKKFEGSEAYKIAFAQYAKEEEEKKANSENNTTEVETNSVNNTTVIMAA